MPLYAPLIRLEVVHGYFADPARLTLTFRPDAASADWIERTGSVIKAAENRLAVFYDAEPRGRQTAMAAEGATELVFDVTAEDPLFVEYSAAWLSGLPGALRFRGADAQADAEGIWRLAPAMDSSSEVIPAGANLRLRLPVGPDPKLIGRRYRLDLESRATAWKYILLDDWGEVTPAVVDPAGAVTFAKAAQEPLADGRRAFAITSTDAIPMAERPAQRFQLRAAAETGTGSLLIATLPAAAPGRLGLDASAGSPRMVSEIYVSR